ncbi:MAG: DUF3644 domain-containing protein [Candidatus Cloacimonadaceae bacterium]|nr:DUF3644 domain-containing protein [Candidatus Cloacimonadaceae bacterium]
MPNQQRIRRISSISNELVTKSRESALAAVQIFNSPMITFKSEIYIVLMHIAWTYLLHAYYRKHNIEYRYFTQKGNRRVYDRTKKTVKGKPRAYKYWELERCLNESSCPLDKDTINNLRFLIGIRHEIEHQMTTRIDSTLSAKFQACCLNYNEYVKAFFGDKLGIDKHLAFSLQFTSISQEQIETLPTPDKMPSYIQSFIEGFENQLSEDEFNSPKFAYRVLFVAKTANHKGQADQVIEFVKSDSPLAADVNRAYTVIKETEKPKYRPGQIVSMMKEKGYKRFGMTPHTNLWKDKEAKDAAKGYGVMVAGTWYWYDKWIQEVLQHCKENAVKYGKTK